MKKFLPIMIILAVIIAGGAFYGGIVYQRSKMSQKNMANFPNAGQMNGTNRAINNRSGMDFVSGEVLKQDVASLTIKLKDGGSRIILYASSTPIMKSTIGSVGDLQIGQSVSANGTTNSDGSLSAQAIQIRSEMPVGAEPAPGPVGG
ncbi:MAG: hypothetical protein WC465_02350 [Patescibacteria group bacterium]